MKQTIRSLSVLFTLCLIILAADTLHAQTSARTIEIHAHRFAFAPSEITLKPGETVTLHLISDDVPHSLLIPGLKINQVVTKGHPVDVTLTPSGTGDFHGQCGRFCGSGHAQMLFTVHVKE